jgi:hypothetical protein
MLPARWRLFRPVHGSGMLAHCRDRLVCVLVLELGGGVRFPYIDQSLFGRIETLHSICPFDVSYQAFPWLRAASGAELPNPHVLASIAIGGKAHREYTTGISKIGCR